MKSRQNKQATVLLVAVIACAPFIAHCGSDSTGLGTGGSGGEQAGATGAGHANGGTTAPSAGSGGRANGGAAGMAIAGGGGDETGGSNAGTAGDTAGSSGSNSAGTGGTSGNGGASGASGAAGTAAGIGGASGASGFAGTAGASGFAGASGSGGSSGGGASGSGGVSGSAGASGSGGVAGSGGSPGHVTLSKTELDFDVECPGSPTPTPQVFTVSNTGGSALTWSAAFDATMLSLSSSGSTLAAGAHVDVTVSPVVVSPLYAGNAVEVPLGNVTIASDVSGQAPQVLALTEVATGYYVTVDSNKDFGTLYIGQTATLAVHSSLSVPTIIMTSSNPAFMLQGLSPQPPDFDWALTFTPTKPGVQTTTLTVGSELACVWPPNTFTATGNGVYDTTCTHVGEAYPCGVQALCQSSVCVLQASVFGEPVDATTAVPFTAPVAYVGSGTDTGIDRSAWTLTIDWGDGASSPGVLFSGDLVEFGGTHTYAHAGDFVGTVTLQINGTGASTSDTFTAHVTN